MLRTYVPDATTHRQTGSYRQQYHIFILIVLRGTIVNRTNGIHKNLYIYPFLLTIFGPINYGPCRMQRWRGSHSSHRFFPGLRTLSERLALLPALASLLAASGSLRPTLLAYTPPYFARWGSPETSRRYGLGAAARAIPISQRWRDVCKEVELKEERVSRRGESAVAGKEPVSPAIAASDRESKCGRRAAEDPSERPRRQPCRPQMYRLAQILSG